MNHRQILGIVLIAALSGLLGGALPHLLFSPGPAEAQSRNIIQAYQLIISDSRGRVRAAINPAGGHEEYTGLTLYDKQGRTRMVIQVNPGHQPPTLHCYSPKGKQISSIPLTDLGKGRIHGAIPPVARVSRDGKADSAATGHEVAAIWNQIDQILISLDQIRQALGN